MKAPVRATKAGSGLYTPSTLEKCREGPAADGAGAFAVLVGFALNGPGLVKHLDLPSTKHVLSDDGPDEPKPAKPSTPKRGYTATPGLMSHMLRYAHTFEQQHGRLPTADERAAERERFRRGAGLHSPADDGERHKRMRREAYLRRKARAAR